MDLIDFREEYCDSPDFKHLVRPFIYYVPGRGSERPVAMVLGDSPGAAENNERKPYPGRSEVILEGLLGVAGLSLVDRFKVDGSEKTSTPANAYITHMIKYRLPGAFPNRVEIKKSARWVEKEWEILGRPPAIITLGTPPFICFKGKVGRTEDIGHPFRSRLGAWVYPMANPNLGLHNPKYRETIEQHWHALGGWLKEEGLL